MASSCVGIAVAVESVYLWPEATLWFKAPIASHADCYSQSVEDLSNGGSLYPIALARPLSYQSLTDSQAAMPSVIKRTTLRLLSSLPTPKGSAHPVERDINRQILMNSAPDREALFMGDKSLEEIRRTLKIEAGPPEGTRRNSQ